MPDKITHALISVSNKEGLIDFAKGLVDANIILLATGGTANLLRQHQLPVQDISTLTGFPEILEGRVKTLHPKLYGGILSKGAAHEAVLNTHEIPPIRLVVVNLYPFEDILSKPSHTLEEAIENIDIGGPTLLRAAAKNFSYTTAIVHYEDYAKVLKEIKETGNTTASTRLTLAQKVFSYITHYDAMISDYFLQLSSKASSHFPERLTLSLKKNLDLRYGENPHQKAAMYHLDTFYLPKGKRLSSQPTGVINAKQVAGKPLSYNNILDAETALECVRQFEKIACVIVKHANPCAVSLGKDTLEAYQRAYQMDSTSAFGGIVAFNAPLDDKTLREMINQQYIEVIIASNISDEALKLAEQKPNIRILIAENLTDEITAGVLEFKTITAGMLVQEKDIPSTSLELEYVTERKPNPQELEDLLFSWQVVHFVKSNAIVFAKNGTTLGIGAGQMSRVFSSKIATLKAKEADKSLQGAVMASDAFFPFRDSIDEAATWGVSAIIQPGGSIRDQEVIEAANKHNLAMVFTRMRHFRH